MELKGALNLTVYLDADVLDSFHETFFHVEIVLESSTANVLLPSEIVPDDQRAVEDFRVAFVQCLEMVHE